MKLEFPFSEDAFKQQCLAKAGGRIVIKPDGPIFKFDTKAQHNKYLELQRKGA